MYQAQKTRLPWFRKTTAGLRKLPDFLIIGGQRCGTTSLHHLLSQHPQIGSSFRKEVHYFDYNYSQGLGWYRANFPFRWQGGSTCDATPFYIFHPHAPQRAFDTLPQAKLVAILRNPVDRAYSHYQLVTRNGHETLSFAEAIDQEEERLQGEREKMLADPNYYSYNFHKFSYQARGRYAEQLEDWLKFFPRERLKVIKSEEFYAHPEAVMEDLFYFLGLEAIPLTDAIHRNRGRYSAMDNVLREKLNRYFQPFNRQLNYLLGADFDWA